MQAEQAGSRRGVAGARHGMPGKGNPPGRCFLCAYSDTGCDVASVEGTLVRVAERGGRGGMPIAHLRADMGVAGKDEDSECVVVLPPHARLLIRALAALPAHTLHELRLRVFHLIRAPEDVVGQTRQAGRLLITTPASAVVLEPDVLLNITDINNAEYCVRQYPLRRMVPSAPTAASLRGTVVHSAFKELLKRGGTGDGPCAAAAQLRRRGGRRGAAPEGARRVVRERA